MSNQNSNAPAPQPPSLHPRSGQLNAFVAAVIAAIAGVTGAGIGAFATVSSAEKVRIESCVKRIDEREQLTRKKAEVLLGSIGQFIGMSATTEDIDKIALPGQQIIRSAFELTAYAPPELNVISLRMAFVIYQGLIAKTTEQKIDAIKAAQSSLDGWSANYSRLLDGFDKSRAACST